MENISELERLISIRIIQEDAEAIYSLLKSERDPIFSMEIIPYYALFIQSCQEFMGDNYLPESTALEIKDIRNHIKSYADSFGKTKRRIASVDNVQDSNFKSQLRLDFLKGWNIHLNLGTYWTEERHVIGNTQQLADFLGVDDLFDSDVGKKQYELGYQIGSFVASVRSGLAESLTPPVISRESRSASIKKYYDINTNIHNPLFVNDETKELNLFFLHLLCNLNFTKYVLRELLPAGNTWVFRVEYIVTYYTFRALQRLKNYCENNSDVVVELKVIDEILESGEDLFQSKLRNCMMHYSLENQGVLSIEHIEKPFFGIIESCFEGMEYQTYLCSLCKLADTMAAYLEGHFDCSGIELQNL